MPSPSAPGTIGQLTKPEYRNWLALGHALTTELRHGLRPFVTREMESFYRNVSARVAGPCTCVHIKRRKPNEYHDMRTCQWANILQAHHDKNRPNWKQSDGSKWMDPILGPWEIAKLFLPDQGGHADIKSADDMDIAGFLNLMSWCSHFTVSLPLIKAVRDTRNDKWVHVPQLELSDADKRDAFDTIENLLQDPSIVHDPDAQQALREVNNLRHVSDLQSMEAQVLADLKEILAKEISSIKNNLTTLMEEYARNKEQQNQLQEQHEILKNQLDDLNWTRLPKESQTWPITFGNLLGILVGSLIRNIKSVRKIHLISWFMFMLLCNLCIVLEDSYDGDGE